MDLKNKVVLVTGASGGIGKATAKLFSREGAKVILATQSAKEVEEMTAHFPNSHVVSVDMTKPQEVQRMVQETHDHYGRIDVLINNTGQESSAPMEHVGVQDFARLMAFNIYGPLIAMQAAIPLMKEQGGGAVVNISSGVAKAASAALSKKVSKKSAWKKKSLTSRTEFKDRGISVSLVYQTDTTTDFHNHSRASKNQHTEKEHKAPRHDLPKTVAKKILETLIKRTSK